MKDARRPLRLLLSYHYFKDVDLDESLEPLRATGHELDVFCDSGAFSAFTVGKPVVEAEYIAWTQRWAHVFNVVCGPDVIGDPKATLEATERMRDVTGAPALPTFHVGEPWEYLDRYCAMSDYLALGGMVPYASGGYKILDAWCAKVFARIGSTRVHGFGCTTWKLLQRYPWHSVDSSSWTSFSRYAQLQLFDRDRGQFETVNMANRAELLRSSALLETYGLRAGACKSRSYDRLALHRASIESWHRAETWLATKRVYLVSGGANENGNSSLPTMAKALR